jgi:hypothetical protein
MILMVLLYNVLVTILFITIILIICSKVGIFLYLLLYSPISRDSWWTYKGTPFSNPETRHLLKCWDFIISSFSKSPLLYKRKVQFLLNSYIAYAKTIWFREIGITTFKGDYTKAIWQIALSFIQFFKQFPYQ